jgi:beta-lactamase superfamily II metal-dependent hydrolase
MISELPIRDVTVELLRAGPPHNQLLSPLTQYLGICGDSGAQVVRTAYEHGDFIRKIKTLRYDTLESDRAPVMNNVGNELARMLSAIPGLPGSLTGNPQGPETLIHLRIVLSASELALLPFEMAKVPVAPDFQSESWLALQVRAPVCITRRERNVHSQAVRWPAKPRILFISADPGDVPFVEHRQALLDAIEPFRYPRRDDPVISEDGRREQFGELLTILKDASFKDVVEECGRINYTHIHVLAHGCEDQNAEDVSYAMVLRSKSGDDEVISGARFASAIAALSHDRIHRPTLVTMATCDSGNGGSVLFPGASFAHVLHQAGVPMVVTSQFPLSKEGSVLIVRKLYRELLWGKTPWITLHRIRTELHGLFLNNSHDWASLVVYESLPANLSEQLEETKYLQCKRAIEAALEGVDLAVRKNKDRFIAQQAKPLFNRVQASRSCLPLDGRFGMECLGLRATSSKRLAEVEYKMALAADEGSDERSAHLQRCYEHLDNAFEDYRRAVDGLLADDGRPLQRIATLHWVLVQMMSVSAITGKAIPEGLWEMAKIIAERYGAQGSDEEKAWTHASLAELWLLRLADPDLTEDDRSGAAQGAKNHVLDLVNLYPWKVEFPIKSTFRQLLRYEAWWGQQVFEQGLRELNDVERQPWAGKGGLLETASELIGIFKRNYRQIIAALEREEEAEGNGKKGADKKGLVKGAAAKSMAASGGATALLGSRDQRTPKDPFFEIEMLPAAHGDCLWIRYGDGGPVSQILIDCGTKGTYKELQKRVKGDSNQKFELFILSHIDDDHIGGAIPFFSDEKLKVKFDDIWFNGWKQLDVPWLNAKQGEIFSAILKKYRLPWNKHWKGGTVVAQDNSLPEFTLDGGMRLTILSPTKQSLTLLKENWKKEIEGMKLHMGRAEDFEGFLSDSFLKMTPSTLTDINLLAAQKFNDDPSAANGSSIAVLAEYGGKSALLAGDAHAPLLAASIRMYLKKRRENKLKIDAFKVAHHASQNNLNIDVMQLLDCRNYLISTDGTKFNHPDREAIGRIIKYGGSKPRLHFNFLTKLNAIWAKDELKKKYKYETVYPGSDQSGLRVKL